MNRVHTRRSFAAGIAATTLLTACNNPKAEIKDLKSALQVAYGQKKFKEVLSLAQKGLELSLKSQGDKHPDTLYFAQSLSEAYSELGDRRSALTALTREINLRLAAGQSERKLQGRRTLAIQFAELTDNKQVAVQNAIAVARDIGMDKAGAEPQPVYWPESQWPLKLIDQDVQADVTLEFGIDASGAVVRPRVVNSTNVAFDSAALDGIKSWRFTPVIKGSQPVESSGHQFTLMFRRPRKN
jgi:TonB family protein